MTADPRILAEIDVDPGATLTREDGRWVLCLRRDLRHAPDRVWRMVTEPEQLRRWSPIVPDRVLDTAGPATSREEPTAEPADTEVLAVDPGRELVHRWGGHLLRWTLTPLPDGTRLELRHTFDEREAAASLAAGWRVCLGSLAASAGGDVERVVGQRAVDYGWAALRDRYERTLPS